MKGSLVNRGLIVSLVAVMVTLTSPAISAPAPSPSPLTFSSNVYRLAVSKATQIGTQVLQLTVLDNVTHVRYQLINVQPSDNDFFLSPNGSLLIARLLNRNRISTYSLTVSARNTRPVSAPSYAVVVVTVTDGVFPEPEVSLRLFGNESVGQSLYTISASSTIGSPFQYNIIGDGGDGLFILDSTTGRLSLSSTLPNYDYRLQYRLVIEGQSVTNPLLYGDLVVTLWAEPVDGGASGFAQDEYFFVVSNETHVGEVFGYVSLFGCNVSNETSMAAILPSINYTISNTNQISIDSFTGALSLASLASISQNDLISGVVTATTRGGSSFSADIRVTLVPTKGVVLEKKSYSIDVSEDVMAGSLLAKIDGGTCNNFTIVSGDCHGLFSLNRSSGDLHINSSPRPLSVYSIIVGVSCGRLVTYVTVDVRVRDVNNSPSFDRSVYKVTIPASTPLNTNILTLIFADPDPPGAPNGTTALGSTDLPSFLRLDPEGELVLINAPLSGFNAGKTDSVYWFNFSIVVSDRGSPNLSSTTRVVLVVTNDAVLSPLSFTDSHYSASIMENSSPGTLVLSLPLKNPRAFGFFEVSYKLLGSPEVLSLLTLSPSGFLLSSEPIDRERYPSLSARVRAEYNESVYTETTVSISVLDVVDTAPVFKQESYTINMQSPPAASEGLIVVQAITQDSSPTNITYSIETGDASLFSIQSTSGSIATRTPITSFYNQTLIVKATSSSGLYGTASVTVLVGHASSGAPQIRPVTFYLSTFSYLLPSDSFLGELRAFVNERETKDFVFSLGSSTCSTHKHFQISGSGLYVRNTVTSGNYRLNVSLSNGEGVWFDTITVRANLLTNGSLDHTLSLVLPGLSLEDFLSRFLTPLRSILSSLLSCTHECLDVVSVQTKADVGGVRITIAARERDLVTYRTSGELRRIVEPRAEFLSSELLWTIIVLRDGCADEPCSNPLHVCSPFLSLTLPYRRVSSTSLSLSSLSSVPSSKCSCPEGYDSICTQEMNECRSNPCHYDGKCTDLVNDFHCSCPLYSFGKDCSVPCRVPSSCGACHPNPCLNGGVCGIQAGLLKCGSCPAGFSGPLCELTTARVSGGGGASLGPLGRRRGVEFSFSFVGVQPNALLFYAGQLNDGKDYISVDIVLGLVRVSVQWGNWSTVRTISSKTGSASDGQWHTVEFQLNATNFLVNVTNCSETGVIVERDITKCSLSLPVHTSSRIINLDSPLYLFSSLGWTTNRMLSQTPFSGCLGDMRIGGKAEGKLVDFSNVVTHSGATLIPGCSPSLSTCESSTSCEGNEECVHFWNGSRCHGNADSSPISFEGVASSYEASPIATAVSSTLESISFELRTVQDGYRLLLTVGEEASLEMFYGSLIFNYRPSSPSLRPLSLTVDAHINDGYWHNVSISLSPPITRLAVDRGRVVADSNRTVTMTTPQIKLGGSGLKTNGADKNDSEGYIGCVQNLKINSVTVTSNDYNITSNGIGDSCSNGSSCSPSSPLYVSCPSNSLCVEGWRSSSCRCDSSNKYFHNNDGTCIQPCAQPLSCFSEGTCTFDAGEHDGFICVCNSPFSGLNCETNTGPPCKNGLYRAPEKCDPCVCDREGSISNNICDYRTGTCNCRENIPVYGTSCKPCNCNVIGSNSTQCNEDGKCPCKPGIAGDRCDTCQTGFVGFGPNGCREGIIVSGSFIIGNLYYEDDNSLSKTLITQEVLRELESFVLPTTLDLSLTLGNSDGVTVVTYDLVSDSRPRGSVEVSAHLLASVMQTILRRDCIGRYNVIRSSLNFNFDCLGSLCDPLANCNSSTCFDCPVGTSLDAPVICRSSLPRNCTPGVDTDQDGFPDACDSCPYWFNPRQDNNKACMSPSSEYCPREKAGDVLWSEIEKGNIDTRLCPPPLTGNATRLCDQNGKWEEPNFNNCRTFTGQQLNTILEDLTTEPPSTQNETIAVSIQLGSLISSAPQLYCRDLDSALGILTKILNLESLLPIGSASLKPLAEVLGLLGSSRLAEVWVETGCDAGIILNLTEHLGGLTVSSLPLGERLIIEGDSVSMSVSTFSGSQYTGYDYSIDNSNTRVSLPNGVISLTGNDNMSVSMTHFPDLSLSLPFTDIATDPIIGSSVWSIQLSKNNRRVTTLEAPISITFAHTIKVNDSLTSVCVTWNAERNKWVESGCQATVIGRNSTTCSCSHLSDFTVFIVPYDATPSPPPMQRDLHLLYYVSNTATVVIIVVLIFMLILSFCCFNGWSKMEKNFFLPTSHLLLAGILSLYIVLFLVDQTQSSSLCVFIGFILEYLILVVACLFVMALLVVLFSSKERWNKLWMFALLSSFALLIIPLLCVALSAIIIYFTQPSIADAFSYPDVCWIKPTLYYCLIFPLLLIVVVFVTLVLFMLLNLFRSRFTSDSHREAHIQLQANALLFLVSLFVFIVINLTFTILSIHALDWSPTLQSTFSAIVLLSALISGIVISIIVFRTRLREFFVYKFQRRRSSLGNLQGCSNASSFHEEDARVQCDPLYQTIGNPNEELYQSPVYHQPMQTTESVCRVTPPEYHELEEQPRSGTESDNETDVDLNTLQQQLRRSSNAEENGTRERRESNRRISPPDMLQREEEEEEAERRRRKEEEEGRTLNSVEPRIQEDWFETLDVDLCSPATPNLYATAGASSNVNSPVPPPLTPDLEDIDKLYVETRAGIHRPALVGDSSEGGGDYVDLKGDAPPTGEHWYEDPESARAGYRNQSADKKYTTALPLDTSPRFDDAQYATIHDTNKYTPDAPRRVSIQKQAQHYSSFDNMSSPQPPVPGHTYAAVKENNSHNSPSPRRTSVQSQLAGGEGIGNGGHFVGRRLSSQTRESGGTSASVQLVNIADSSRVLKQGNGSQTLVSLV